MVMLKRGLADTRNKAQALIMSGFVLVDDQKITKSGHMVADDADIRILREFPTYVSRGGDKLQGAWKAFQFLIEGRVCLDVGLSTGGFTDFLLRNGAKLVFGVDVAYGEVDFSLRNNSKVVLVERTNARTLTRAMLGREEADDISLVVMDVSFISVTKVLPAIQKIARPDADYVILIKPQFEAEKGQVGKGGIIRDPAIHDQILKNVTEKLENLGFLVTKSCESPILGGKGNKEFFFLLKYSFR